MFFTKRWTVLVVPKFKRKNITMHQDTTNIHNDK